ncbi:hypothetical protein CORC01_07008 [Colletotrichum orchidophilum]|uniref:Uncharacterized protein n=1 Tax=Colletotrichum orchidophilum TaxID=1209926 RepID=A0A1G4B8F0_9PEZI|nr:uncharacterized protein CORC01_07008 [Colletotrichum orchidophilum]OHE97593.1 hypothetical protein CORC01_07008 [Colletotrichum orchidophilum]
MDSIYNLLGLTKLPLIPDYDTDVSVAAVYVDYFAQYLAFWKGTGRGRTSPSLEMPIEEYSDQISQAPMSLRTGLLVSGIRIGEVIRNLPKPVLFDTWHRLINLIEQLRTENTQFQNGMTAQEAVFPPKLRVSG